MGGRPAGTAEPATAPMLALQPGMDRLCHELAAQRDRQIRLQSVQTDLALDLPPSIPLPDGEEIPYGSSTRLQLRDPDQESEIYQKCIRPPPNRTVWDGESPPPYRSSSGEWGAASSVSSCSTSTNLTTAPCHSVSNASSKRPADLLGRTVRCLSGKRCHHPTQGSAVTAAAVDEPPTAPSVVVPPQSRRCRRLSAFSDTASTVAPPTLASLPTVKCATPSAQLRSRSHSVSEHCEVRTNDPSERSTV